jgi:hypothetical protein
MFLMNLVFAHSSISIEVHNDMIIKADIATVIYGFLALILILIY